MTLTRTQQLAALGHALVDIQIFEAVVRLQPDLGPAAKEWKIAQQFLADFHRLGTEMELISGGADLDILTEARLSRSDIGFETLAPALKKSRTVDIVKNAYKNLDGADDADKIIETMDRAVIEYRSVDEAGVSYTTRTSTEWGEMEYQDRLMNEGKVLDTGIRFIDDISDGVARNDLVIVAAKTGVGKCLGLGTPVMKYDGSVVSVEDVRIGDLLMGPDSAPRTVLSTTRGTGNLYRVTPKKGDPWVCNDVHVLTLVDSRTGEVSDTPLNEFLTTRDKTYRNYQKQFSVGVEFPPGAALPIDPYFLGLWIGGGGKSCRSGHLAGVRITSADNEIAEALKSICKHWGLRYWSRDLEHFLVRSKGDPETNPLLVALRTLMGDKVVIPVSYLTTSREDRLELLAGLIDSDGTLSHGCYDWVQKNKETFDGFVFLARSLGFRVTVRTTTKRCQKEHVGEYWRATVSGDLSCVPVRLSRKKALPRRQIKNVLRTGISLVPIGEGQFAGFELDGDGRFLLGDFTVTHNSQMLAEIARNVSKKVEGQVPRNAFLLALEAYAGEMQRRLKWPIICKIWRAANPGAPHLDWGKFSNGRYRKELEPYEAEAQRQFAAKYGSLQTLYRSSATFGIDEMERAVVRASKDNDLVLLDHLHYVDTDSDDKNVNEYGMQKKIVQKLREITLTKGRPVIAAAHFSKPEVGKYAAILPPMEKIMGSSDISKIATQVILLGNTSGLEEDAFTLPALPPNLNLVGTVPTFIRLAKSRLYGAERTDIVAVCFFDRGAGQYRPQYMLGRFRSYGTKWIPIFSDEMPGWATEAAIRIQRQAKAA